METLFNLMLQIGPGTLLLAPFIAAGLFIRARIGPASAERVSLLRFVAGCIGFGFVGLWVGAAIGIGVACGLFSAGNLCGLFGVFGVGPLCAAVAIIGYAQRKTRT